MAARARLLDPAAAPAVALAALLATSGVLHFTRSEHFERIVPRALGRPRPWVAVSGAAELACAAGLGHPRTRRSAALATAALFVAVFPANVTMAVAAVRSRRTSTGYRAVALARLPLQVPLVLWALRVAGSAGSAGMARVAGASR